jgi:hypothetical protein
MEHKEYGMFHVRTPSLFPSSELFGRSYHIG